MDDDALLEDDHPGSQTRRAAAEYAPVVDVVEQLRAGKDVVVDDGNDDAASSCSQRSATPGSSRLSATESGASLHAFDCLRGELRVLITLSQRSSAKGRGRKADATASSNNPATHKTLNRTKSEAGKEAEGTRKTDAGHDGRSYERALSILDALKPSKPMAAVVDAALLAVKAFDHCLATATRQH